MRIQKGMVIGIGLLFPTLMASAKEASMATKLANSYLKSFGPVAIKPLPKQEPNKKKSKKPIIDKEIPLTPREQRAAILNEIFEKSSLYQNKYTQKNEHVLNPYAWNDLHLFCGTTSTPSYHFLSRINKSITLVGEVAFASLIGAPLTDLSELTRRQQLIAFFNQTPHLSNALKKKLQQYKASEKSLLSFWTETDPLYNEEYAKYVAGLFYTDNPTTNKSASSLQTRKILKRDIWNIYFPPLGYPIFGLLVSECSILFGRPRKQVYQERYPLYIPLWNFYHLYKEHKAANNAMRLHDASPKDKKAVTGGKAYTYFVASGATLHTAWNVYSSYCYYKEYGGILQNLALRMADVQTFLTTIQHIHSLVKEEPQLEAIQGSHLVHIRALLARTIEQSEVVQLLRYLQELPLRSWSYLRHNAGKLLAAYKLFVEHKGIFHDAMYELGELDAFLATATLMEETKQLGTSPTYTFTKFLSPEAYTRPRLTLAHMWNPMLEPAVAVGNALAMGQQNDTQNIILTGPNAGGKSTFLTGAAYAVLLSQTLGIAPAERCEMTPFAKINTYIDITDDIAAGKSLFQAEASRFKEHLQILKELKPDKFSFSIFDEPFSGTNPKEAAAAGYSVLSYIASYKNAFHIVATHYPTIMLLEHYEPTKGFKNYKVFIKHKKGERINYTYKVVRGESDQTIAIEILEEEGYGSEMLQEAKAILNDPQRL